MAKYQNRKKADRPPAKTMLLEAGTALFAEKGYAGTSVREIVERVGVTKPVLYYHFKNKEGMFRAILDRATEQQETMIAHTLKTEGTVLDRLSELSRRFYQGVMENRDLVKMIHNLIFGPPQGAPQIDFGQYQKRMVEVIKNIYSDGMAKKEVQEADLEEVAILVLSLLDFSFHLDHMTPASHDPGRPERLLRLAFRGLGKTRNDIV